MNKQEKEQLREQRIKQLAQTSASANKIQQTLQQEDLGIKRKELLARIRMYRHTPKKTNAYKYVPKKYLYAKQVTIYAGGTERYIFYSERGIDLKQAVALAVERKKRPKYIITKAYAEDYINNPSRYSKNENWEYYDIRS